MPTPANSFCLATAVQAFALTGIALPALAQDPFEIPLDLQAIPTVEEDESWTDVTRRRPLRWELAGGVRGETLAGPLGVLVNDTDAAGFVSLALDADLMLAPNLSLQGRAVAYVESGITEFFVQRFKVEYAPETVPVRLSIGKDYLAWSFTDLAHVMDLSPRESARIDATDTGDDYAHPYAMASYELGAHQFSFVAMSEGHNIEDVADDPSLFALRYETQIGTANLSAQVIRRDTSETEFGFGVNTTAGSAVLSLEASVASRPRLPLASLRNGGGVLTPQTTDKSTFQAVAAGRMPISTRWQAEAAYLFNGHGYSDTEWETFRVAEDAVLAGLSAGDFRYAGFLSDAQTAHTDQYLRRNYVSLAVSSLEDLGKWSMTVGGTHSLDDGGTFGFATASRSVGASGRLDVSLSGGVGGFETEFARRSKEFSVQIVWGF